MAFITVHNRGINPDWIVRWDDDEASDTLRIMTGTSGVQEFHAAERTVMLAHLTHASTHLGTNDAKPEPKTTWKYTTWQEADTALLTMTRHIRFTDDAYGIVPLEGDGCPMEERHGSVSCVSGSGDSRCTGHLGTLGPFVHCAFVYPGAAFPKAPGQR